AVDEPVADEVVPVVQERARRGRRFARRRALQSEPVIAAVDEVVEGAVAEETVVDELIVDTGVEEPVIEAAAETVVDHVEEVAEAVAVDEPVVDEVVPVV